MRLPLEKQRPETPPQRLPHPFLQPRPPGSRPRIGDAQHPREQRPQRTWILMGHGVSRRPKWFHAKTHRRKGTEAARTKLPSGAAGILIRPALGKPLRAEKV